MIGYDFHPEARLDIDEIWEFIGLDNLDAADRLIQEILGAVGALVSFPRQGHRRPDLAAPSSVHCSSQLPDRLRAGSKAIVGCRYNPRAS